jgi:hypothetical protein
MTPAEKMQSLDLPVALLLLGVGIGFIVLRKKLDKLRETRVAAGELTAEEARKNEKLTHWGGYLITACGTLLVVMWIFAV